MSSLRTCEVLTTILIFNVELSESVYGVDFAKDIELSHYYFLRIVGDMLPLNSSES
jgi:hypothetical protein